MLIRYVVNVSINYAPISDYSGVFLALYPIMYEHLLGRSMSPLWFYRRVNTCCVHTILISMKSTLLYLVAFICFLSTPTTFDARNGCGYVYIMVLI
jgi:hypothetical protein